MSKLAHAVHRTLVIHARAEPWQPKLTRWQRFVRWLKGMA